MTMSRPPQSFRDEALPYLVVIAVGLVLMLAMS